MNKSQSVKERISALLLKEISVPFGLIASPAKTISQNVITTWRGKR